MPPMPRLLLPILLGALAFIRSTVAIFYFDWPAATKQCNTYKLIWWEPAHAPFTAFVVPINSSPFVYHIPDDAFNGTYGEYDIELQLNAGTNYVVFMSDASGFGNGGSSQVQFVQQSARTSCLSTAAYNATGQQFSFQVSGVANQCERGFELAWYDSGNTGPYNFTVIPLDQRYFPYDVPIEKGVKSLSDWRLNMTEGSRFTIMMNNVYGYGTGGVGGIYSVSNGSSDDCVSQSLQPTGTWPVGLATNTLSPGTLRVTSPSDGKKLKGGAIAGLVIGLLAAVAIIIGAIVFFMLRRRRRNKQADKIKAHGVDLAEESDLDGVMPMVEPYHNLTPMVTTMTSRRDQRHSEGSPRETPGRLSMASNGDATTVHSSAGFAGVGAGTAPRGSIEEEHEEGEEVERPSGPGVAGPIPRKTSTSGFGLGERAMAGTSRDLRVVNHDDRYPPGAAAPAASPFSGEGYESRRRRDPVPPGITTYRRHEDAGRVVDLPPLYTDISRDSPSGGSGTGSTPEYEPPSLPVVHQ